MSEESNDSLYLINTYKLAFKLWSNMKTKEKELLQAVRFKKKGHGFYYSTADKKPMYINRGDEWYYVPFMKKDEQGRVCLYSPYLFKMAIFIMVPEDEIEYIGLN
tara:strand:- start:259 stop:573 length:315 start_codon:yes stop_codon:yes gene_type:complete